MLECHFASDDLIKGCGVSQWGVLSECLWGGGEVTSIMVPGEDVGVSFCLGQVRGSH